MPWQLPFITIDQNQLRDPDAVAQVVDDCRRNGLQILLPDGAFLEFSKSGCPFDTARNSLQILAPHRELVCASRELPDMLRDELRQRDPCASLVQKDTTKFLRSILAELEHSEESALRKLVEGPVAKLMPPALAAWNNHEENKRLVQRVHDALKAGMPFDQLKSLRRSPEEGVSEWLSSAAGMRFVFDGLKARGANDDGAWKLTRTPSVNAGFLFAIAGLALYWLAIGGLAPTAATKLSGDLNDVEYVVLGALSRSLATFDRRASIICRSVVRAFETLQCLPHAIQ